MLKVIIYMVAACLCFSFARHVARYVYWSCFSPVLAWLCASGSLLVLLPVWLVAAANILPGTISVLALVTVVWGNGFVRDKVAEIDDSHLVG